MAKSKKSALPIEGEDPVGEVDASPDDATAIEEGSTLDYITGGVVPDTEKERVRQRIARALFHEYGISVDDMVPDFKLRIDGRLRKLDLVIFEPGAPKEPEHIRRIAICEKEPVNGRKSSYKMRSPEEAEKEFGLLKSAMAEATNCKYGLWTNGLEFFFFQKEVTRFDVKFKSLGDWPQADESIGTRDVASMRQDAARRARDAADRLSSLPQLHPWQ